ncbi:MAG: DUF4292 domain-containing protein [Balneolaceae bacterium]
MNRTKSFYHFPFLLCLILIGFGCRSSSDLVIDTESLDRADITATELTELIPDYRNELMTISGSGRAIVSEPGNSERVSLQFQANRLESLIRVRNSAGIEGGQIYVDSDSLMVYNRLDKTAEKIPLLQGNLTSVGSLASVNVIDLLNFTIDPADIDEIYNDDPTYVVLLNNRTLIRVSKGSGTIISVVHANDNRAAPYSRVEYEGYAIIEQLHLPRKVSIYSKDGNSRATLLVQRLEINPLLPPLGINLPDDVIIQRL